MTENLNPVKLIGGLVVFVFVLMAGFGSFYTVDTGEVAMEKTFGKASEVLQGEGLHLKMPFFTDIVKSSTKQTSSRIKTVAYTADQQQVTFDITVMTEVPRESTYLALTKYGGELVGTLVSPRVTEALKTIVARQSAENSIKNRDEIKNLTFELAKSKIGNIVKLNDVIITNIDLSDELERAIEAKMVQEQEASKSKFIQQKAEIEAKTAIITAEGEARALAITGQALRENKNIIDLEIVKRWNGISPQTVVIGNGGGNVLLPLNATR